MIKRLLPFLILLFNVNILSQIPVNYYQTADGKTGYELKTALYNIIKGHTDIGYSGLWNAYPKTDIKPDGKVWDIYSDVPGGTPAYLYTFTTDQCGNYAQEGDCYNREHSFPKSWFNDNSPMYSDIFHIYPTDGKVNGMRGSYPYGETTSASWISTNGSKVGACTFPGYTNTIFEPIDVYKGDLARSYFYMATRYENLIASWQSNSSTADDVLDGTADHVFEEWQLNLLLKWHHEDPVSQKEINRNDSIYYLYQHNRNPFIDHPEYADIIWNNGTGYPEDTVLLFEDFETTNPGDAVSLTGWTSIPEQSTVKWISTEWSDNIYSQCSAYSTGAESVISWLVTPVIDFSKVQNQKFSFTIKGGYDNGATLKAYVLMDYTTGENPWDATGSELNFNRPYVPSNGYGDWGNSGEIDLNNWSGKSVHIAFCYTGSDGTEKNTTIWQIDSVKVIAQKVTTAIKKNKEIKFNLYPNPATGTVYISGDNFIGITIQMFNSLGTPVRMKKTFSAGTFSLYISDLPKGLYIIRIIDGKNRTGIKKLIKN